MSLQNSKRSTSKAGNQKVYYLNNQKGVPKIKQNNQQTPMRALLKDKSLEVLKKTFKVDTPPIITYTLEEYFKLVASGLPPQIDLESITIRAIIFKVKNIEEPSAEKIYSYFHNLYKSNTINDIYDLLYKVPLIQVPLYINDHHLAFIAKWRMDIAK